MPDQIHCNRCGWKGTTSELTKQLVPILSGPGNAEHILTCPACHSEKYLEDNPYKDTVQASQEDFEMRLLTSHIEWFKNATFEERDSYIAKRKARLSPEGLRMCNLISGRLRRKDNPNEV